MRRLPSALLFLLLLVCSYPGHAGPAPPALRCSAPKATVSGHELPMAFFATGPSGEVLPDVDGDRLVVLESEETRDTIRVAFKRGVAYLVAQPIFRSVLTVSVSGLDGTRSVFEAVVADTVFHAGPIAPAGEFWSASAIHLVHLGKSIPPV